MKQYLAKIWKTKSFYIISLLWFIGLEILYYLFNWRLPNGSDFGVILGCIIGVVLYAGPIVWVDVKRIKIRNPQPVFIEPPIWKLALGLLISWMLLGTLLGLFITGSLASYVLAQIEAETFAGNFLLLFGITSIFFIPVGIYTVFIKVRYRRIIEYGTASWKRARKKTR